LSRTVEAELLIDNIKTRSHNLYRKGRELERMQVLEETVEARNKRMMEGRAHCLKAEELASKLEGFIEGQIQEASSRLEKLHNNPRAKDAAKDSLDREIKWMRKYDESYLANLQNVFVGGVLGLPEVIMPYFARPIVDREAWWQELFDDDDRLFSCYSHFVAAFHFP
jgi:hypothetical protein